MQFWAYVLENPSGKFYIGSTEALSTRLSQHNDPEAKPSKYAPKNSPWVLVWKEDFPTRGEAVRRERQIKRMKSARWIRDNLLIRYVLSSCSQYEPTGWFSVPTTCRNTSIRCEMRAHPVCNYMRLQRWLLILVCCQIIIIVKVNSFRQQCFVYDA